MGSRRVRPDAASVAQDPRLAELLGRLVEETGLWQDYLAVHRSIVEQLAAQMMADHRLPLEWFDVLVHLADIPGMRLRQKDLRDRLLLSESGISRMLVRIEQAGLIERTQADEDRRGVEIALTPRGQQALSDALDSHLALVSTLFTERLTPTDHTALRRALNKLREDDQPSAPR
jgi:DNA-binding MarR family transcriptional regulator